MRKEKFSILYPVLIFLFFYPQISYSGKQVKTIVVFFSFNANLPSYQNFLEGFRSTLYSDADEPYNLLIEYLDIGRSTDEEYVKHIVEMYNGKLKGNKVDLLITVAPITYSLLKKYGLDALKKTPTIRLELYPPIENLYSVVANDNTMEIKLKFRIGETLKNAFDLFPSHKDVQIISGNSSTDVYFTSLIKQSIKDFKTTHHFTFINGITLDSIVHIARKIPENSVVIIPIYLADKNNIPFSTPEAIRIISDNCKAPVFPIFDSFNKTSGGIGGFVFSYIYVGKETGRIAREILNGEPLRYIRINERSFYQYMYDWRQLKRWNLLDSKVIPTDSIIYHKEINFISEYKWYILVLMTFLISEALLIVYLITLNKRQKEIAKQKRETENLYRELVREDRLSTMVELTASLSHELNQPLTAILYSAQAGKRFLESDKLDPGQAKEIFENIIEDDKRAAGLISSVRSLMKLETREKEKVNLNSLIQDTVNIFNSEAITQNIQIIQQLLNETVFVFGDKIQLQQVILNFLSNAAIAMENIDPVHKRLEISQLPDKNSVTVSVRDSGPGIDNIIKENLFKPFITSRESGFGIGLAVCRSIIEKHNGEIQAENIPGGGAEFSFKLPII